MADTGIDGARLSGVLRLTWMSDQLAHVLERSQAGEPAGTWTGLACPDHGQLCRAAIQAYQTGQHETGERLWQQAQALWSGAWSANYETLKLLQTAGLARFAPARPQRWVIASSGHHCGPHGLPHPHIHNVVITSLTTGMPPHS